MNLYTLEQIKAVFWEEFHKSGDAWFEYRGDEEGYTRCTEEIWREFEEKLNKLDPVFIKKQFVVKLTPDDGEYHNFFAYGSFEQLLKRARLIEKFNLGQDHCVLLFEDLPDALNNLEQ